MVGACDWPSHQQVWAGYNTKTKHSPTLIFLGEQITVAHNIRTFSVDVNSPPSPLVNSERYGVGLGDRWAYYTHTHTRTPSERVANLQWVATTLLWWGWFLYSDFHMYNREDKVPTWHPECETPCPQSTKRLWRIEHPQLFCWKSQVAIM